MKRTCWQRELRKTEKVQLSQRFFTELHNSTYTLKNVTFHVIFSRFLWGDMKFSQSFINFNTEFKLVTLAHPRSVTFFKKFSVNFKTVNCDLEYRFHKHIKKRRLGLCNVNIMSQQKLRTLQNPLCCHLGVRSLRWAASCLWEELRWRWAGGGEAGPTRRVAATLRQAEVAGGAEARLKEELWWKPWEACLENRHTVQTWLLDTCERDERRRSKREHHQYFLCCPFYIHTVNRVWEPRCSLKERNILTLCCVCITTLLISPEGATDWEWLSKHSQNDLWKTVTSSVSLIHPQCFTSTRSFIAAFFQARQDIKKPQGKAVVTRTDG